MLTLYEHPKHLRGFSCVREHKMDLRRAEAEVKELGATITQVQHFNHTDIRITLPDGKKARGADLVCAVEAALQMEYEPWSIDRTDRDRSIAELITQIILDPRGTFYCSSCGKYCYNHQYEEHLHGAAL